MSLRHFAAPRLRHSLLVTSLLLAGSFSAHAAEEMLRKAVGKGAYEMAYSQQENALWVATSQSRSLDKGGVVYRLDPTTLDVTQIIHNDLKAVRRRYQPCHRHAVVWQYRRQHCHRY
ncbi:putative receptor [Klebsiella pneumoniae]|nr:putative receptor [Klebsiella pneumoniae]